MSSSKRAHIHKQDVPQTFGVKTWKQKTAGYRITLISRAGSGQFAVGQGDLLVGGFF